MTNYTKYKQGLRKALSLRSLAGKGLLAAAILIAGTATVQAQDEPVTMPTWWFGVGAGANINTYRGTTQKLNEHLTLPAAFHPGNGVGLYLGPLVEFHAPGSNWGGMLQAGYDSRKGKFDEITTPCNCPGNLSTDLSYITIEPSLRFAPFKSNFYLYAGPRVAFNMTKSFTYQLGINPNYPNQEPSAAVKGDFSDVNPTLVSGQVGAGYDIHLSSNTSPTQAVLSPFVAFQPYYGQAPRSIETWTVSTWRIGAALKFGHGKPRSYVPTEKVAVTDADVKFTVNAPTNIPVERRVRETFPLRNYIFFDLGSTQIPDRYVTLRKDQVKEFKEDNLEVFKPKKLTGRSDRQMIVYYNVMNIIGSRMQKNPGAAITLVGSSELGPEDGRAMSQSVKDYLVSTWSIEPSRIAIEGRDKPKLPSEQPGGVNELALLREGDRRVSIESTSPEMIMEFQSGSQLKPVEIIATQEAPVDSYVTFKSDGAKDAFTSWTMEIKDEKGKIQNFGPYTHDDVAIPGKAILGTRPQGDYKVTMIGQTKSGKTVKKEVPVHMVLWTPAKNEEGMRFSVIYEFNDSKAIQMYDKYLTEVVVPKIPKGATVDIHGYTDVIGDDAHNRDLSLARANDVKAILEKGLTKAGRTDVRLNTFGFGEDETLSPFNNKYPEERSYNRTVIIDVIPKD